MLRLFTLLAGVAAALTSSPSSFQPSEQANPALDGMWEQFKLKFSKVYSLDEEVLRRAQWERNVVALQRHNLAADMGVHDFTLGLNEYADWSQEEYQQHLTGYRGERRAGGPAFMPPENMRLPESVDWREEGLVTPVKNQGACGSCWAFSATGALEGQHRRKAGKMAALSEQQLVDCSGNWGNNGCNGGLMDQAFDYIQENKGIDSERSYPYTARDGDCKFRAADVVANDTGYVDIPAGDEKALMQAVATVGPVSVAIDAGHLTFQLYRGGVYWSWFCSSSRLDHGVLVVGYGTEHGQDYWLVKNSWGESWGLNGYIKMARNMNNMCGIATAASYPLV